MIRAIVRILPAAALLVFAVGCNGNGEEATSQPSVAMGAINDTCPIMGGEVDPNASTVSYEGATIGFCCDGCVSKWNSWSDAQKADFIARNR